MSLTETSPTLLTDAWRHITRYLCPILCSFENQQSKIIGYKLSMYSQCYYYFRKVVLPQYVDYVKVTRVQLFVTPWPSGSSVHEILQASILEWVAIPFSRGSSQPRDQTQVSLVVRGFFTVWASREAQEYWSGWSEVKSLSRVQLFASLWTVA